MTGQEEVIQPDNVAKVRQDVAKPGDQPAESKDCTHLSSDKSKKITSALQHWKTKSLSIRKY